MAAIENGFFCSAPHPVHLSMFGGLIRRLRHPLTADMDVDDPRTTELRRKIIRNKPFLQRLYEEWYHIIGSHLPAAAGPVIELGSGAGFMKDRIPGIITTEVLAMQGVDCRLAPDGLLPFRDDSLRAIVMTNVLHHVRDARLFFREAARTIKAGGAVLMIEPWVTTWSRFVYQRLHEEPFHPDARQWEFPHGGPLSGANGAMPWILFERDRRQFEREFPEWSLSRVEPLMPFTYLLSGGVSLRSLAPGWAYTPCRMIERAMRHAGLDMAMFALISLVRGSGPSHDSPERNRFQA
jgi:SAM-dependent methyltransferase